MEMPARSVNFDLISPVNSSNESSTSNVMTLKEMAAAAKIRSTAEIPPGETPGFEVLREEFLKRLIALNPKDPQEIIKLFSTMSGTDGKPSFGSLAEQMDVVVYAKAMLDQAGSQLGPLCIEAYAQLMHVDYIFRQQMEKFWNPTNQYGESIDPWKDGWDKL